MDLRNAIQTVEKIKNCAVEAGIYDHWFLCFGSLLGAVRPTARKWGHDTVYSTGIMEHDDDVDIGVFSDRITKEQEDFYVDLLRKSGLMNVRGNEPDHKERRKDTGRLTWMTLRGSKPPIGTKACHWFWLPWNGHYWHTKGKKWINFSKFSPRYYEYQHTDNAVMLGIPMTYLERLTEIEFDGLKVNVPLLAGSCVDHWYPGWLTPKHGGASSKKIIARVPKWEDQLTWQILPTFGGIR